MKNRYNIYTYLITIMPILFLLLSLQTGCSNGGKSEGTASASAPTLPAPATTLNGMVSKGPVSGATVKVFAVNAGIADTSAAIGTGQTVDGGSFSIDLGSHEGPVLVEVTGGMFTDEASGTTVALKIPLHAVVPNSKIGETTTAAVTPITELAYKKAKGSGPLTANSISDANASVALTFGLKEIISVLPVRGGETDDQKKYAEACNAFSKIINDNKHEGESLDDALGRLLGQMGNEEENGGLSADSAGIIDSALSSSNTGTNMAPDTTVAPGTTPGDTTTVSAPTFTMGLLHLGTVGIPFAMTSIDVTLAMTLGVTVDYDRITGVTPDGVVAISGVADFGNNNVVVAKFTPAFFGTPGLLHIVVLNPIGFGLGEFATVQFNVIPGGPFPLTDSFIPVNLFAKGITGLGLTGVAVVPLSVEGVQP